MLRAVVVGVNSYHDENIEDLRWARHDAECVAGALSRSIHPSERQICTLLDGEATKTRILKAIGEELPRLQKPEDIVLLYFAGHGCPEFAGSPDTTSRYLAACDTEYESVFATGIDLERDLARLLQRCHAVGQVVVFLDACFSGLAGGRSFRGASLQHAVEMFRGTTLSLKDLDLGEGRAVMAACKDDQFAREDDQLEHGLFTYHVLNQLSGPDSARGGTVTITSLYDQVLGHLEQATGGRQIPVLKGEIAGIRLPVLK